MQPAVKFCGLTDPADAAAAVAAGADYLGVIFAGGPRRLAVDAAARVLAAAPPSVERVGVFGAQSDDEIAEAVTRAGLAVVQLHADPTPEDVARVRERTGAVVWAALRTAGVELPGGAAALFEAADAVVLDARVAGALGGTGHTLPWVDLAPVLAPLRARGRLVLAGGLAPENVRDAVRALRPEVVDVSSGVEHAPGRKDHARLHSFATAVRAAAQPSGAA